MNVLVGMTCTCTIDVFVSVEEREKKSQTLTHKIMNGENSHGPVCAAQNRFLSALRQARSECKNCARLI